MPKPASCYRPLRTRRRPAQARGPYTAAPCPFPEPQFLAGHLYPPAIPRVSLGTKGEIPAIDSNSARGSAAHIFDALPRPPSVSDDAC